MEIIACILGRLRGFVINVYKGNKKRFWGFI